MVKLNATGNVEWQKTLGGSDYFDLAHSIQQTSDGGYIVAGESSSNDGDVTGNHGLRDFWIIKLNTTGDIEWQKCFGGSNDDEARSIQQTTDGGYIVAGNSLSDDGDVTENHGGRDFWVVKLDSTGNIEWQKSYGGSNDDGAHFIRQTEDGGYIIAGNSESNDGDVTGNHGEGDFWIVKLVGDGTPIGDMIEKPDFAVFPNPTLDILTIMGFDFENQLTIINATGQIVLKKSIKGNEETLDVSGLPAGVYFINGVKFIKK